MRSKGKGKTRISKRGKVRRIRRAAVRPKI
jgi:hypothetical protein